MWRNLVLAIGVIIGLCGWYFVAFKTREEMIRRDTVVSRIASGINNLNGDVLVPDPKILLEGGAAIPLPKPDELSSKSTGHSSTITTTWPWLDGSRSIATQWKRGETADAWLDEHDSVTTLARKRKEK